MLQFKEGETATTTALAAVKQEKKTIDKLLDELEKRYGQHPLFKKIRGMRVEETKVFKKGQELAEDIREKYETSDHPMVHKAEVRGYRMGGV